MEAKDGVLEDTTQNFITVVRIEAKHAHLSLSAAQLL
jgi:hypothetical protein